MCVCVSRVGRHACRSILHVLLSASDKSECCELDDTCFCFAAPFKQPSRHQEIAEPGQEDVLGAAPAPASFGATSLMQPIQASSV